MYNGGKLKGSYAYFITDQYPLFASGVCMERSAEISTAAGITDPASSLAPLYKSRPGDKIVVFQVLQTTYPSFSRSHFTIFRDDLGVRAFSVLNTRKVKNTAVMITQCPIML